MKTFFCGSCETGRVIVRSCRSGFNILACAGLSGEQNHFYFLAVPLFLTTIYLYYNF